MKLKTLLLSTALATSLLLGACGNSNHDSDTKEDEKKRKVKNLTIQLQKKGCLKEKTKKPLKERQ